MRFTYNPCFFYCLHLSNVRALYGVWPRKFYWQIFSIKLNWISIVPNDAFLVSFSVYSIDIYFILFIYIIFCFCVIESIHAPNVCCCFFFSSNSIAFFHSIVDTMFYLILIIEKRNAIPFSISLYLSLVVRSFGNLIKHYVVQQWQYTHIHKFINEKKKKNRRSKNNGLFLE